MPIESLFTIIGSIAVLLTVPWVVLSLLSTFCDASVGYFDEWLLRKVATGNKKTDIDAPGQLILISGFFGLVVSLVVMILVLLLPSVVLKLSYASFYNAFAAGMLEVLWLIPYFYALDRGGALNTTPLFQSVPIFSLIIGLTFFGETPALVHVVAMLFIISGAIMLNYSPELRKLDYRTITLMLLSSAIISVGYFLFKDAAEISNFATAAFGNGLGMGLLSLFIWFAWKPYREQFIERLRSFDKKIILIQTANEGLYTVAAVLNQLAIVLGPSVMIVSAMSAFHPLFTLLIGGTLAKFGLGGYQQTFSGSRLYIKVLAILAIAIGTAFIASYGV